MARRYLFAPPWTQRLWSIAGPTAGSSARGPLIAPPLAGAYLLESAQARARLTPIRADLDATPGDRRRLAGADHENRGVTTEVEIYTDGACKGNPGPGGWGALLVSRATIGASCTGGEPHTTNNRMELTAAIEALAALKRSCRVQLYTDSQYVRNGITEWLPQWKARGWKTADTQAGQECRPVAARSSRRSRATSRTGIGCAGTRGTRATSARTNSRTSASRSCR